MSFGLKNLGATYLRLVNKVFEQDIGKTIEVYVDDMLVKCSTVQQHTNDLVKTFATLRTHKMMLNPTKCTFGVEVGQFFGFMVSERDIEAIPGKIKAFLEMSPPRIPKKSND